MYGIIIDNAVTISSTPPKTGYKPIEFLPMPTAENGFYYEPIWIENNETIIRDWVLTPIPKEEPSAEEIVKILTGEEE